MRSSTDRWLDALGLTMAMLWVLSCSGGDSPTDPGPQTDSVTIESISPDPGAVLRAGSRVTFRARVRYTLATASSGRISIVIQDQNSRNISATIPQPNAQVPSGNGAVELADTVDLPATGITQVNVFFPLLPAGASSTSTVQVLRYPVQ